MGTQASKIDVEGMTKAGNGLTQMDINRIWAVCSPEGTPINRKELQVVLNQIHRSSPAKDITEPIIFLKNRKEKKSFLSPKKKKISQQQFTEIVTEYAILAFPNSSLAQAPIASSSSNSLPLMEEKEKEKEKEKRESEEKEKEEEGKEEEKRKREREKEKEEMGESEMSEGDDVPFDEDGDDIVDFEISDQHMRQLKNSLDDEHYYIEEEGGVSVGVTGESHFDDDWDSCHGGGLVSSNEFLDDEPQGPIELQGSYDKSVPFEIMSTIEVYDEIQNRAREPSQVFEIPLSVAVQALSRIQWKHEAIAEAESPSSFLKMHGASIFPPASLVGPQTCLVCYLDDLEPEETFALSCGHVACKECWEMNIKTQLNTYRPNHIECPGPDCTLCLLAHHVQALGGPSEFSRYQDQLIQTYVQNSSRLLYCTNPKCRYIIKYKGYSSYQCQIKCYCGEIFCFICTKEKKTESGEGHFPATCAQYEAWNKMSSGGVFQFRKKPCPKCKTPIIKCGCPSHKVVCQDLDYCPNQACNHMSCPQCSHDFCWICLKEWKLHGSSWYNCKFVDPSLVKNQEFMGEFAQARHKYEDFNGNYKSYGNKLEKIKAMVEDDEKLREIVGEGGEKREEEKKISSSGGFFSPSPSSSSFVGNLMASQPDKVEDLRSLLSKISEAEEEIMFCYHTLKNTYIILYFAKKPDDAPKEQNALPLVPLFEDRQQQLENLTQKLSVMIHDHLGRAEQSEWRKIKDIDLSQVMEILSLARTLRTWRFKLFSSED